MPKTHIMPNLKQEIDTKMSHPLEQFHFCPRCGSSHFVEHNAKSKLCQDCGFVYYFNPSAATVAFILNERRELLVVRRAKEPAKGTLDLPGGFSDLNETSEQGVCREVKEETGLDVTEVRFQFSLPNRYLYSDFLVHTIDMFYLCRVRDTSLCHAMDDAAEAMWIPLQDLSPEQFGLGSVRKGVTIFLAKNSI